MFDISFTELMLIGIVALVVIGPQRLPRVARTIGHLVGRAQRYVGDVKSDIQREMELDQLNDLKGQMEEAAKSVKSSVKEATDTLRDPLEEARTALKETADSMESFAKTTHEELNELSATADRTTQKEPDTPALSAKPNPDETAGKDDTATNAPDTATPDTVNQASRPSRALSDAELADLRLAQSATQPVSQNSDSSDNDHKTGTPQ